MATVIKFPFGVQPVLKHGTHDQSSHGNWAHGSNGTVTELSDNQIREVIYGSKTVAEAYKKIADSLGKSMKAKVADLTDAQINVYRGMPNVERGVKALMNGTIRFTGIQTWGQGVYVSEIKSGASNYGNPTGMMLDGKANLVHGEMKWADAVPTTWDNPRARILGQAHSDFINYDQIKMNNREFSPSDLKNLYWAGKGYDGYRVDSYETVLFNNEHLTVNSKNIGSSLAKHLQGKHDQMTHGSWANKIADQLDAGGSPTIDGKNFSALLMKMGHNGRNPDITKLRIAGTPLIGGNGLGIARIDMPQIPTSLREDFLATLQAKGVTVDKGKVNPLDLKPVQKQIGGARAGAIYNDYRKEGSIPKNHRIIISQDGYVIDGHHHWAAAVAFALDGTSHSIPAWRINLPVREALAVAKDYSTSHGIKGQSMSEDLQMPAVKMMKHLAGQHDQSTHGSWAHGGSSSSNSIFDHVKATGGITIRLKDGYQPARGYIVAKETDHSLAVNGSSFFSSRSHGSKIIADYAKANKQILSEKNNHLGIWYDSADSHKVIFDVSEVHHDLKSAMDLGVARNQISIWDMANMTDIPTGGTGGLNKGVGYGQKGNSDSDAQESSGDDGRRDRPLGRTNMGRITKTIRFDYGIIPLLKHYGGGHDQSTHGNWAHGGVTTSSVNAVKEVMARNGMANGDQLRSFLSSETNGTSTPPSDILKTVLAMYTIDHQGVSRDTGQKMDLSSMVKSADVTSFHASDGSFHNTINLEGDVMNGHNFAGTFERQIGLGKDGQLVVDNHLLSLDSAYQSAGFGKAFLSNSNNYLSALGGATVRVQAAYLHENPASSGGFVWAKLGYGWDKTRSYNGKQEMMTNSVNNIRNEISNSLYANPSPKESRALTRMDARLSQSFNDVRFPTPIEIAYTGYTKGAKNWVGQEVMGFATWWGQTTIKNGA